MGGGLVGGGGVEVKARNCQLRTEKEKKRNTHMFMSQVLVLLFAFPQMSQ